MMNIHRVASASLAVLFLTLMASAQVLFVDNRTDIPQGAPGNLSRTENIDFADVDGDGDFDALFADGGDLDQDQNRLWINLGHAQGGRVGTFEDETDLRCPAINDQSRDIELADIDGDGDPDAYIANTSALVPQASRFWINSGVHSGYFVDETATRWIGLGGPGSSIDPALVLPGGGFIDWSGDADFADLDADGDLDLVHTSYGSGFTGQVPTRLFRNDSTGHFREFNPSGFRLPDAEIADGDPGLWAEGIQQNLTWSWDGSFCDVATNGVDVEIGDVDGDFDLDLLLGAREGDPRMFLNRLVENGGGLGFRDVTRAVFPPGYASGVGQFEQEMGDLDGDLDLDIYGVGWAGASTTSFDGTLMNFGGLFGAPQSVTGSGHSTEEVDFIDFDNDGKLDAFLATLGYFDKLVRNASIPGQILWTGVDVLDLPFIITFAKDGEVADVDEDGDYDVFVAGGWGDGNLYWQNVTEVPDVHAPRVVLERPMDRTAGPDATVVRVAVYDNTGHEMTRHDRVWVTWNAEPAGAGIAPLASSGGQIFRGALPGALEGRVELRAFAEDRYGNRGASPLTSYSAAPARTIGSLYCTGDGSGSDCPCFNAGHLARGCANGFAHGGAQLVAEGSASAAAGDLVLLANGLVPLQAGLYFQGDERTNAGQGLAFGDGLRCAQTAVVRLEVVVADAVGGSSTSVDVAAVGGVSAGQVKRYQLWYRDATTSLCGAGFNLTNGVELEWLP